MIVKKEQIRQQRQQASKRTATKLGLPLEHWRLTKTNEGKPAVEAVKAAEAAVPPRPLDCSSRAGFPFPRAAAAAAEGRCSSYGTVGPACSLESVHIVEQ